MKEYIERFYRERHNTDNMLRFTLCEGESDIEVLVEAVEDGEIVSKLGAYLHRLREELKSHISRRPEFLTSLVPIEEWDDCEAWIKTMYHGSAMAQVGPMACVAGSIAQELGQWIHTQYGPVEYMIENGGDLFVYTKKERRIQVFAGESILSDKIRFKILPSQQPIGICTSAGTVGPSLSFGIADAVVVLSKDNALADAVATRLGNEVKSSKYIDTAIQIGKSIKGIEGILIIQQEHLGVWGNIELV